MTKSVTIITPTIGRAGLTNTVESVKSQEFDGEIRHLLVVDGPQYIKPVVDLSLDIDNQKTYVHVTPENTGADGFYGHRIYAAYPHLVSTDYIMFLDEENTLETNHVSSMVVEIENKELHWAYSLRNIYSQSGEFHIEDCCESLGQWPIYFTANKPDSEKQYLIDTSCYCFRRNFIVQCSSVWHHGWGGDRRFFNIIKQYNGIKFGTTGLHTLNYMLDEKAEEKYGSLDFFIKGNQANLNFYEGKYPWQK